MITLSKPKLPFLYKKPVVEHTPTVNITGNTSIYAIRELVEMERKVDITIKLDYIK